MNLLRKITSVFIAALMLLATVPITASAETQTGRLGTSNVYYELTDDGTLRLYGSGATPNYSGTNESPFVEIGYINKIIVDEGVTKLGDYIFERCDVTEVSLPTSLRELGMFVFGGCEYLEEIELQSATRTFGIGVFYHCSSLKKITFHVIVFNYMKMKTVFRLTVCSARLRMLLFTFRFRLRLMKAFRAVRQLTSALMNKQRNFLIKTAIPSTA